MNRLILHNTVASIYHSPTVTCQSFITALQNPTSSISLYLVQTGKMHVSTCVGNKVFLCRYYTVSAQILQRIINTDMSYVINDISLRGE